MIVTLHRLKISITAIVFSILTLIVTTTSHAKEAEEYALVCVRHFGGVVFGLTITREEKTTLVMSYPPGGRLEEIENLEIAGVEAYANTFLFDNVEPFKHQVLVKAINKMIDDGWRPVGGYELGCQAVVRP